MFYFQIGLSVLLLLAAISDLKSRLIPFVLVSIITIILFLVTLIFGIPLSVQDSVFGAFIVGGVVLVVYLVTRGKGIGEADIIFAGFIGWIFGWVDGLIVFAIGNFLALLVFFPLILIYGKKRMKYIPLVTFLVLAIFLQWGIDFSQIVLGLIGLPI